MYIVFTECLCVLHCTHNVANDLSKRNMLIIHIQRRQINCKAEYNIRTVGVMWFPFICLQMPVYRHYSDAITNTMASQIISLTIVYSTIYSAADQSNHQSSASLAFVQVIHRSPVNSRHKGPVTRKMFPLMASSWVSTSSWTIYKQYLKSETWMMCQHSVCVLDYLLHWGPVTLDSAFELGHHWLG